MGSIEIFSDSLYISISFWTLALLLFVSIYSSFNLNINKAVWYLFAGLTVEFLTSWYGYYISYYNTAGVSISILVAIELFFLLISIVLLALAASEILIGNAPAMAYVTTATVFGLIAIIYFTAPFRRCHISKCTQAAAVHHPKAVKYYRFYHARKFY